MILQSLELLNFKNYEKTRAEFCEHINCLVGLNGSGKTNVLDAIYYLSLTKSATNSSDTQNIRDEQSYFVINGQIQKKNEHKIHCSLKKGEKKKFTFDGSEYDKMSQHLGQVPVVLIAPNDDELIRDTSETRRKYFDSIISQIDSEYLQALIRYNHFLKQRNALLKSHAETRKLDKTLLATYDAELIEGSMVISKKREDFVTEFEPHFEENYARIAQKKETVRIAYSSKVLTKTFKDDFAKGLEKDVITQRTNLGIHRDDYAFMIGDHPVKKFGSQGQQKSFLVSLKFAQFTFMKEHLEITPILLLDDIFDKLDDGRIQRMLEIITSDQFQQIFITDAREERTMSLINNQFEPLKIFRIEDQKIVELSD